MNRTQKEKELQNMERVWNIFTHPFYIQNLKKNGEAEKGRIFCHHNMSHFLDVARLAYIFKLERGYAVSKDVIYAAALLHDIGKWQQYENGTPHEEASKVIAGQILKELDFAEMEKEEILQAIQAHRTGEGQGELAEILYDADKMSRACFACEAEKQCNWKEEKKNKKIGW